MQEIVETLRNFVVTSLPKLLGPVLVLVVGWLVALAISAGVRSAVRHKMSRRLSKLTDDERRRALSSSRWIAQGVYYVLLLFVLLAFFQALGVNAATAPINAFLETIFSYAPRVFAAAVILAGAWLVATLLRRVVRVVLERSGFAKRLATLEGAEGMPQVSDTFSETLYWLVLLLFVPAVLGALKLEGLLAPIQAMVDKFLGFLPNLVSAVAIVGVGWLVARILERLVVNVASAGGLDRLGEKLELDRALGSWRISEFAGLLVKILILVPVFVAGLNALQLEAVTEPASQMLELFLTALPSLFGAVLVFGVFYIIGRVVSGFVTQLLQSLGFDRILLRLGVISDPATMNGTKPSGVVGGLVLIAVMLLAAVVAVDMLGLATLSQIIRDFAELAASVVAGLFIIGVGLFLAQIASSAVAKSSMAQAPLLAIATRLSVIILAGAMGLRQMGLANEIIQLAFGLLLGAVTLAVALAFGFGARDVAGKLASDWYGQVQSGARQRKSK